MSQRDECVAQEGGEKEKLCGEVLKVRVSGWCMLRDDGGRGVWRGGLQTLLGPGVMLRGAGFAWPELNAGPQGSTR